MQLLLASPLILLLGAMVIGLIVGPFVLTLYLHLPTNVSFDCSASQCVSTEYYLFGVSKNVQILATGAHPDLTIQRHSSTNSHGTHVTSSVYLDGKQILDYGDTWWSDSGKEAQASVQRINDYLAAPTGPPLHMSQFFWEWIFIFLPGMAMLCGLVSSFFKPK